MLDNFLDTHYTHKDQLLNSAHRLHNTIILQINSIFYLLDLHHTKWHYTHSEKTYLYNTIVDKMIR